MQNQGVDLFNARLEIERLLCSYAEALDSGDVQRVASLFERGQIRINGMDVVNKGSQAVSDMFCRFTLFYDKNLQVAISSEAPHRSSPLSFAGTNFFD